MKKRTALISVFSGAIIAAGLLCWKMPHAPLAAKSASASASGVSNADDFSSLLDEMGRLPLASPSGREIVAAVQSVRASPRVSDNWVRLGDAMTLRCRATLDTSLYHKIETVYLHAHQLDNSNASSLIGLAWAAGAAHRFDDSVAWASLAVKSDPNIAAAYGIL